MGINCRKYKVPAETLRKLQIMKGPAPARPFLFMKENPLHSRVMKLLEY